MAHSAPQSTNPPPSSSRGQQRRSRILDSAAELFLTDGFGATSIGAIVSRSGGSKATLYAYFQTKNDLLRAVVDRVVDNRSDPPLDPEAPVITTLTGYCEQRMQVVLSRRHQRLLRLIASEAERFPDIGELYYERGPGRSTQGLNRYFSDLKKRHQLLNLRPKLAAQSLIGMLLHHGYVEQLVLPVQAPGRSACRHRAKQVVEQFSQSFLPTLTGE